MKYDTIVIGGGLAGLTAGSTLSRLGRKVLLLEQHYQPGGCATTFRRRDFLIEAGLHEMSGLGDKGAITPIFDMLDVSRHIELELVPEFYASLSDGEKLVFPHGYDAATRALVDKYPEEKKGIRRFMELVAGIGGELKRIPTTPWKIRLVFPFMPLLYPNIIRSSRHTVGSWLDRNIGNEDLKLDLVAHIAYWGDDPYALSMFCFGMATGSFIESGGRFIKGGSQRLSDYLASCIESSGGAVMLGKRAERIVTENGLATGVTYRDSANRKSEPVTVSCDNVVANCAVPLVPAMLDEPYAAALRKQVDSRTVSCSLFCLYLCFDRDVSEFGVGHYSNVVRGEGVTALKDVHPNQVGDWSKRGFIFVDYGKIDSGLAPDGKSVGSVGTVDYLKDWEGLSDEEYRAKKEEVAQILLQRLEKRFPGIRESVEYYEAATPKTMKRYTLNPGGSVYGFAQTKEQTGAGRFIDNSFLPNLYFASAWSFPGGGFEGAISGGFMAAQQMNRDRFWSEKS